MQSDQREKVKDEAREQILMQSFARIQKMIKSQRLNNQAVINKIKKSAGSTNNRNDMAVQIIALESLEEINFDNITKEVEHLISLVFGDENSQKK
jgi:hypothetical protein